MNSKNINITEKLEQAIIELEKMFETQQICDSRKLIPASRLYERVTDWQVIEQIKYLAKAGIISVCGQNLEVTNNNTFTIRG